ncbi:hypothetical protein BDQ12DRAFT_726242 [Crucibulum laeve]|uniref:Uncharacterized protein n=1 Tax=Crucibulum laeve TaxID=68775 RepID=A0A5C3LPN3_9AGAR|nr:hypothetical protein BDQ12DRAFT_726242 [Crucibulum laeve]
MTRDLNVEIIATQSEERIIAADEGKQSRMDGIVRTQIARPLNIWFYFRKYLNWLHKALPGGLPDPTRLQDGTNIPMPARFYHPAFSASTIAEWGAHHSNATQISPVSSTRLSTLISNHYKALQHVTYGIPTVLDTFEQITKAQKTAHEAKNPGYSYGARVTKKEQKKLKISGKDIMERRNKLDGKKNDLERKRNYIENQHMQLTGGLALSMNTWQSSSSMPSSSTLIFPRPSTFSNLAPVTSSASYLGQPPVAANYSPELYPQHDTHRQFYSSYATAPPSPYQSQAFPFSSSSLGGRHLGQPYSRAPSYYPLVAAPAPSVTATSMGPPLFPLTGHWEDSQQAAFGHNFCPSSAASISSSSTFPSIAGQSSTIATPVMGHLEATYTASRGAYTPPTAFYSSPLTSVAKSSMPTYTSVQSLDSSLSALDSPLGMSMDSAGASSSLTYDGISTQATTQPSFVVDDWMEWVKFDDDNTSRLGSGNT